jgi:hypothetical protein
MQIGSAFKRYGLPVRGRIEATILASTTNGLSPRDRRERYRRRRDASLRVSGEIRPLQPLCKGHRIQYPRKGEPCSRPALYGSEYCKAHDPQHRAEVLAIVERARAAL